MNCNPLIAILALFCVKSIHINNYIINAITESLTYVIMPLAGWFFISYSGFPPVSIIFACWMTGAFIISLKHFVHLMLNNSSTRKTLWFSSMIFAFLAVLAIGIFTFKYRIELLLFMPGFICGFCFYLRSAYKCNLNAIRRLFKEATEIVVSIAFVSVFAALMLIDIPLLESITFKDLF